MRALLVLAFLAFPLLPLTLDAQARPLPIGIGERVRVGVRGEPVREGIVVGLEPSALHVQGFIPPVVAGASNVPVAERVDTVAFKIIRTLYVSRPSSPSQYAASAAGWGLLGAAAGTLLGTLAARRRQDWLTRRPAPSPPWAAWPG